METGKLWLAFIAAICWYLTRKVAKYLEVRSNIEKIDKIESDIKNISSDIIEIKEIINNINLKPCHKIQKSQDLK